MSSRPFQLSTTSITCGSVFSGALALTRNWKVCPSLRSASHFRPEFLMWLASPIGTGGPPIVVPTFSICRPAFQKSSSTLRRVKNLKWVLSRMPSLAYSNEPSIKADNTSQFWMFGMLATITPSLDSFLCRFCNVEKGFSRCSNTSAATMQS